jgi:transcriptional regulator with XRE-family HTH domain
LGEHVRKRRLEMKLTQRQVADQLGVNPWTVLNWEKGYTEPPIEAMASILRWLGYDPCPAPQTLPERIVAKRRAMGWSIREAARQLGVDEGTWGAWERGATVPKGRFRLLLDGFLRKD